MCSSVHLVGEYNGKVFEEKDLQFTIGEGEDCGVVAGVEKALESFKLKEKSKLKINSKYAYKAEGNTEFGIPPNANLEYTIEMKNFEKSVAMWSLEPPQKVEQAKLFKEKGTTYLKGNKVMLAIKMFKKAIEFLEGDFEFQDVVKEERNNLILSTQSNLALCYLKTDQNIEAKNACNKVLEIDPKNEKALFRRGQALLNLASPDIALKDFQYVIQIEPKNSAAVKQISVCNEMIKKELAREKKLYANMFDKFAKKDREVCENLN